MSSLHDRLYHTRVKNYDSKYFIPNGQVRQYLSKENVQSILWEKVPKENLDDLVNFVLAGAMNVFAVLVLIERPSRISDFTPEYHQESKIDDRLPFSLERLESILNKGDASSAEACRFYERQWEFTSPIFSGTLTRRDLPYDTILPFLKKEPTGSGGFGTVYEIDIEPSHQRFPDSPSQHVCKEFNLHATQEDFNRELQNLQVLQLAKHQNIVECVGSFTFRGTFNLMFRKASGESLQKMLISSLPKILSPLENLFAAIHGLCSALANLHSILCPRLELKAIGCHHDLKPSNILVHHDTFILADFGLSRIKFDTEDSATTFKHVSNSYVAPECEQLDGQKSQSEPEIGRASDVWSLGCIMLEIMVLAVFGSEHLKKFVENRAYEIHQITFRRFHKGRGIKHPVVEEQFRVLEQELEPTGKKVILLIEKMLHIQQDMRPKSGHVAVRMQFIVLERFCRSIIELFEEPLRGNLSAPLYIEFRRFWGWLSSWDNEIAKSEKELEDSATQSVTLPFSYDMGLSSLQDLRKRLEDFSGPRPPLRSETILGIQVCNDKLLDILSDKARRNARSHLISSLLTKKDQNILDALTHSDPGFKSITDIQKALTGPRVTHGKASENMHEIDVNDDHFRRFKNFDDHVIGRLQSQESGRPISWLDVIVERKRIPPLNVNDHDFKELKRRLQEITEILYEVNRRNHGELPVLECCGYFFDREERGLVYKFPRSSSPHNEMQVQTLNTIIRDDFRRKSERGKEKSFPTLSDRFALAKILARSLLTFHQAGWLQKSISSHNIAFFFEKGFTFLKDKATLQPYFLGYVNSRQDRPDAFTEGPNDHNTTEFDYQHPDYVKDGTRFKPEYDYYSLGIILLEIAFWRPLHEMKAFFGPKEKKPKLAEVRKTLLENELPKTAFVMGANFHDAVRRCLTGDFKFLEIINGGEDTGENDQGEDDVDTQIMIHFDRLIVQTLEQCTV